MIKILIYSVLFFSSFLCGLDVYSLERADMSKSSIVDQIFREGQSFIRHANLVAEEEPFIYPNKDFEVFQRWTLRSQGYVEKENIRAPLVSIIKNKRHLVLNNRFKNRIRLELQIGFARYLKKATHLSSDLFDNLAIHINMSADLKYRKKYLNQINQRLDNLFPHPNGEINLAYRSLDCDYVAQPLNALWYSINSLYLIRRIGVVMFGEEWENYEKGEIESSHGTLLSLDQIEAFIKSNSPIM